MVLIALGRRVDSRGYRRMWVRRRIRRVLLKTCINIVLPPFLQANNRKKNNTDVKPRRIGGQGIRHWLAHFAATLPAHICR